MLSFNKFKLKMVKKVIIIGAGPAGLGAAYRLAGKSGLEVMVFEQGKKVMERKCPSPNKCVHCNRGEGICDQSEGVAGAGAFSDGKFMAETILGFREVGSNMIEYVGTRENERYWMLQGKEFFQKFGVEFSNPGKELLARAKNIYNLAGKNGMDYLFSSQAHIGTDKLPELMKKIEDHILHNGVEIKTREAVKGFDSSKVYTSKGEYEYDRIILAPGRKGADWLEQVLKSNNLQVDYRAVDIGFRVETDACVLEELCSISRDVKLSFRKPGNGDLIRTFCVCPNGKVTRETYEKKGFNLVNGASDSDPAKQTNNTNFALLVSVPLTDRVNCNNFADSIAKTIHLSGGDQVVGQRFGELVDLDRRSKYEKLHESRIEPTLKDVYIGDVGIGMPYRIVKSLIYGIGRLSGNEEICKHKFTAPPLMPGLDQFDTWVYAPEMKRNGLKIKADDCLRINDKISIAGDGAGVTRGIVPAAASGILAADGILKDYC